MGQEKPRSFHSHHSRLFLSLLPALILRKRKLIKNETAVELVSTVIGQKGNNKQKVENTGIVASREVL